MPIPSGLNEPSRESGAEERNASLGDQKERWSGFTPDRRSLRFTNNLSDVTVKSHPFLLQCMSRVVADRIISLCRKVLFAI
jgi:hypothetical protein